MTEGGGTRLALVGAGGWACRRIAAVLSGMGALAAVCDQDEQRAASCGQKYSVGHYGDVGGMIRGEAFDGAVVAAPAAARAAAISELLGAGKHVCAQWPPACGAAGVGELLGLADKRKAVLSCLPVVRPSMAAEVVRNAASSGAYGRLMSFDIRTRGGPAPAYTGRDDCDYGDGRGGGSGSDDADGDDADDARARAVRAMQADAAYTANLMFDAAPQVVFAVSGGPEGGRPGGHLTTMLGYGGGLAATISINLETGSSSETAEAVLEGAVIRADLSEGFVRTEPAAAGPGPGPGRTARNRRYPHDSLSLDLQLRSWLEDFADAISRGGGQGRRGRAVRGAVRGAVHALAALKAARASLLSARRGIPIYLDLR
ncbi:MAG: Gfo/Idh/MocA family oxidoreductase [Thaumarchaeota archaeon]|nr:Gfo/Idh/MocA family oxidoreductase [Nitrososphaerota archaeon]